MDLSSTEFSTRVLRAMAQSASRGEGENIPLAELLAELLAALENLNERVKALERR